MTNKRFALRISSPFPLPISMIYLGQYSAGQGIVQELSRVGCRILGNDPVGVRETLSLRLSFPSSEKPLIIQQATVQWVKGLEFGVAFKHIQPLEADRLQQQLKELMDSRSYSRRPTGSPNVKPPAA